MSATHQELLDAIHKLISDMLNSSANSLHNYGCQRSEIMAIWNLTCSFPEMTPSAREMLGSFDSYESYKQEAKKKWHWDRVIDALCKLKTIAEMCRNKS